MKSLVVLVVDSISNPVLLSISPNLNILPIDCGDK